MANRVRERRRKRWRSVLGGMAVVGVVLGAVLALAVLRLRSAERELRLGRDLIESASHRLELGELVEARADLTAASLHLTNATGSLHNRAELRLLEVLPVASTNLEELRSLVGVANQMVTGGARVLRAATPLQGADGRLEVPLATGSIPLDAVAAVQVEAEQLAASLPRSVGPESPQLVGQVADLRKTVLEEAVRRRNQLDTLARGLELLREMAGGSGARHYLVAVANSAEMSGTGGMVLSYGALVGAEGDFQLRQFGRIDELALPNPLERTSVPTVPDDYLTRWEGFDPLGRWRNATLAADFEVTAPVLETMYLAATGSRADGVIQVDPQGLAAILEDTGPVEVPGLGTVSAANVVDVVLSEAYRQFPDIDARSDVLGDVAEAVFDRLVAGDYPSLRPLAEALLEAVDGRHILMHSVTAGPQEQLRHFGAAGGLPERGDVVSLTVQNVSANKLDYYVDTSLALTGDRPVGSFGHLRAEVTVTNTAPAGVTEPRYVFGPFNDDQEVGLYRGVVSLYLPAGTRLVATSGDSVSAPTVQSEDGRPVVGFNVDVPAGASRRVVLDLELAPRPPGPYELVLVPSPRVRPTQVRVELGQAEVRAEVAMDRTWRLVSGRKPIPQHAGT